MDVLRFINSNAIRDYLREIDYQFNTLEAAYLVHDCRFATLKEKHEAFREILETMPDMAPEKELGRCVMDYGNDSIHKLINLHIENKEYWIKEFYGFEKAAYCFQLYWENGDKYYCGRYGSEYISDSLEEITEFITDYLKDDEGEVARYTITCKPSGQERQYTVRFNREGGIMDIDIYPCDSQVGKWYDTDYELEMMWFGFPTPFKKGDILYDPGRAESSGSWDGPFVFEETATEWYKRRGGCGQDCTDMTATGLFLDENNEVYGEVMHDYMSLEYYPKEKLTGEKRILIALSNFKKGEIEETLLLNAYRTILLEEYAKKTRPHWYTHEGMVLAGLEDE